MEVKWFFIFGICVVVSLCLMLSLNTYNASKSGLEQCPENGAGGKGYSIWVKSCKEYTESIIKENK